MGTMALTARFQRLCDQAIRLHQAGNLAEAERLYLKILAGSPTAFTPQHLLGVIRAQQGRQEEAATLIASALKRHPGAVLAWINHGNILSEMGRHAEAVDSYTRALALRPGDAEILHNRGRAFLELGDFGQALTDYDRLLAFKPRDLSVLKDRGNILWALGRNGEARTSYEDALSIQADDVEALNNLGNILRDQRQFEMALAKYDKALSINPDLAETLNNRGAALSELHRLSEALSSLDRALALKPDLAEAWNNRGDALRETGNFTEALANFDHALSLAPDYPAALNNRAKTLCELNRISEGFSAFLRSAALVYGGAAMAPTSSPQAQHDRAQRAYLSSRGEPLGEGLHLSGGARMATPALRAAEWSPRVAAQWPVSDLQVAVIDDFLTEPALAALRRFCWGSAVWRKTYDGGYLGAFPETGFACPLLAQVAEELRDSLPAIFDRHPLRYLWAFKYDGRGSGTHVHADEAAVNVNFWITPDEANRNPAGGGLVVWDVAVPPDWDFARFNADARQSHDFLAQAGAKSSTIPYRANRAVIFDSNLFHQTDRFDFAPGYLDHRINITLLYGRR